MPGSARRASPPRLSRAAAHRSRSRCSPEPAALASTCFNVATSKDVDERRRDAQLLRLLRLPRLLLERLQLNIRRRGWLCRPRPQRPAVRTARSHNGPRSGPDFARSSDVETDVEDIAVGDDVRLPFEPLEPPPRGFRVGTGLDEVVPPDHLAPDEAARDVRVDGRRRVERSLPLAQRPRARLLLRCGEERDLVELLLQPADDLIEGRRAVPKRGGLLGWQVGE